MSYILYISTEHLVFINIILSVIWIRLSFESILHNHGAITILYVLIQLEIRLLSYTFFHFITFISIKVIELIRLWFVNIIVNLSKYVT